MPLRLSRLSQRPRGSRWPPACPIGVVLKFQNKLKVPCSY